MELTLKQSQGLAIALDRYRNREIHLRKILQLVMIILN